MSFLDEYSGTYLDTYGVPSGPTALAISIAGTSGNDPELGTPYNAGLYVYGATGSLAGLTVNAGAAELQMLPAGPVTSFTAHPAVVAAAQNAGAANERMLAVISSGKESGNSDAALQLFSAPANNSQPAQMNFEFGGASAVILTPAGFSSDTPHLATLINGWAGSGSGYNGLYYMFTIDGQVRIFADIINTTATGNSVCFTLPAGPPSYRPVNQPSNRPAAWNNPAASNSATPPWVTVFQNGNVQVSGIQVANKEIFFDISVPLVV